MNVYEISFGVAGYGRVSEIASIVAKDADTALELAREYCKKKVPEHDLELIEFKTVLRNISVIQGVL